MSKAGGARLEPQLETFAQVYAAGATATSAHAAAGYAPDKAEARKLSRRKAVVQRVAYLRRQARDLGPARLAETVVALLDVAAAADCATPAGLRDHRLARIDARKLYVRLLRERMGESPTA